MTLIFLSFVAGILTVAAPCILPLLPVIIGGSLAEPKKPKNIWLRPLIITTSLAVSVIIFSLLIKASTALLGVPQVLWQLISGIIVALLGVHFLWPKLWENFSAKSGLFSVSNAWLGKFYGRGGTIGAIFIGAALGPVFSSCSPTYALIVASILPASFLEGFIYLVAYAAGMSVSLMLIAVLGQVAVKTFGIIANPKGWFHRSLGVIFIIVGVGVIFGLDKKLQTFVLDQGWYAPVSNLELKLR
ncbi:MAG: cytochrome c biogenesis protein CcdA [Patescibacteria group bacterium]